MSSLGAKVAHAVHRWRHRKARRRAVQELERSLTLIVDFEALVASVAARIDELFNPDQLLILQQDREAGVFRPGFFSGGEAGRELPTFPLNGRLVRWFQVNETCLMLPRDQEILEHLDDDEQGILSRHGVRLCAPLRSRDHILGLIILAYRRPGWHLSHADGELLRSLADQTSLAFQNAALYRAQHERLNRLHRAERLAAIGQLAAGVAHEIRNPLTAIRSTMQYFAHGFEDRDPKQELARDLIDEVDRIDGTVGRLLQLTRTGEHEPIELDAATILAETLRLIEAQAREQGIDIERLLPTEPLLVRGDPGQLKQVFLNLLLNSMQAMPEGGKITVSTAVEPDSLESHPGPCALIEVTDTGEGVPPDRLSAVFDAFYTTKHEGTGLGLAICHGIIQSHRGEIELRSTVGQGTVAAIKLPLLEGEQDGENPDRR